MKKHIPFSLQSLLISFYHLKSFSFQLIIQVTLDAKYKLFLEEAKHKLCLQETDKVSCPYENHVDRHMLVEEQQKEVVV